ncbi:MAG: hypothetical protein IPH64_18380 [Comamonadaceae bacterium]|nr:hypothetical protein [Comamonadaceae bacterium]
MGGRPLPRTQLQAGSHTRSRPDAAEVRLQQEPGPVWIEDIDLNTRRSPALAGRRATGRTGGRLQAPAGPCAPWECTLIEGLEGTLAMFIKMHHSLIDGISGMKLLRRHVDRPQAQSGPAAVLGQWHCAGFASRQGAGPAPTMANAAGRRWRRSADRRARAQLAAAFGRCSAWATMATAWCAFRGFALSVLNGRGARRALATQHFTMERLRTLAAPPGSSTTWSGDLRRRAAPLSGRAHTLPRRR